MKLKAANFQRCCKIEWKATCALPPIADNPSAPRSPTSTPFLPVHSTPALVSQLLCYCTLYYKIKNVFFTFVLVFMYYLCEKYYKPITVQYYVADYIRWVPG